MAFEPKFVTHQCRRCGSDYKTKNCVSDGRYCAMRHAYNLDITGREIIMEDLRQHCLFWRSNEAGYSSKYSEFIKKSPRTMYIEYMIRIHQLFETRVTREDSEKVMEVLGIDKNKIEQCVKDTFEDKNNLESDNTELSKMARDW